MCEVKNQKERRIVRATLAETTRKETFPEQFGMPGHLVKYTAETTLALSRPSKIVFRTTSRTSNLRST